MARTTDVVRVRVPATSANLGPGFDALGLALSLYDEVEAWVCESGLAIEISGDGADLAGAGEDHLVVRAMRAAFAVTGGQPPGLGLRCVNRIPHGRGRAPGRRPARAGHRDGGAPGQRGGLPERRADHRLDRGRRAADGPARACRLEQAG